MQPLQPLYPLILEPTWLPAVIIFAFGAVVGSFLNVVIHRVPNEQSIVFPNSACPKCSAAIKPYDNIPVLSWLILGGKCRNCKAPISVRYPAVELLNALLWLSAFWFFGLTAFLPVALIFLTVTVVLVFIDAEHMILPNVITYPFVIFAILVRIAFPMMAGSSYFPDTFSYPISELAGQSPVLVSLAGAVLGALAGGGILWAIGAAWKRLRGVDAMGLGDVKMMLGYGALLGWRLAFLAIFIAAFAGAVAGVGMILIKRDRNFQAQIPFGIFLGIGSVAALFFGETIISWYLGQFAY
ncbi:MAG: prepilin peptidase [Acidobacteria bacterium]|nr:prepilin peptidase [Acidobacteriota bacterium]